MTDLSGGVDGSCRLCAGALTHQFTLKLLRKYDVGYFRCSSCGSLQTEKPYWIEEAYAENNLSNLDTGAAERNLSNLAACFLIRSMFNAKGLVDFGGGDGLLCRLLRDHGINCFVSDRYASAVYAQGFTDPDFDTPDMVIGFEVIEHFPNPSQDLHAIFDSGAKVVLLSTARYTDQNPKWWYLAADSGQHVFFYSMRAFQLIARQYGYVFGLNGGYVIFAKDASKLKLKICELLLSEGVLRWFRGWLLTRKTEGGKADFLKLSKHEGSARTEA